MGEQVTIKITDDELKQISELRQEYQSVIFQLGQAELQLMDLRQALDNISDVKTNLQNKVIELKKKENVQVTELNKKYGEGNLNAETGLFTPTK